MKFKPLLFCLFISILAIAPIIVHAQEKEVLTNSSITKMVKAKLSEDVIVNKIRDSKTNFDLSTDSLIKLKETGVSDNIINAMQNPQTQPSAAPQSQNSSAPSSGDIFIVQGGKNVAMEYVAGLTEQLGLDGRKWAIMASGEHAQMRIKDKTPVFYIKRHPSEFVFAKFEIDTFRGKTVRHIIKQGFLKIGMDDGRQGVLNKHKIDFDYKKEDNGMYKATPKKPLENGEYAIITETNKGVVYDHSVFDFGVDE